MSQLDLVIRNGTVVTAADKISCDVGIKDGKVALLGKGLEAKDVIDASGRLVLPGGIDSHVHLAERPFYGITSADDFESGSISAACGGTTTIIPFAEQIKGESLRTALDEYHEKATGKAVIDYAFHLMITEVNQQVLGQELPALVEDGCTSLKIYMTYDGMALNDHEILDVLSVARVTGSLVMIHAENDHCIHWLTDKLNREGKTALEHYPDMAPAPVEREATHRAITLGEVADVPVLIVHVSASDAAEQIEWGQRRGIKVFGETCPQYLFLSEDNIRQPGWEGAKYICAPVPREEANQSHLWQGLANGVFQVFSSDHCAFLFDSENGKKAHAHPHFRHVAPGVPGIEVRQALLFSEGVLKGRIDVHDFVALCSTNAAKLYGLYPRKGTIAVGADADIAIWDADREVTLSTDMLHDAMDYTPYEGMRVRGWPVTTLSRGEIVCHEGEMLAIPGRGKFLPCEKSELARPNPVQPTTAQH